MIKIFWHEIFKEYVFYENGCYIFIWPCTNKWEYAKVDNYLIDNLELMAEICD